MNKLTTWILNKRLSFCRSYIHKLIKGIRRATDLRIDISIALQIDPENKGLKEHEKKIDKCLDVWGKSLKISKRTYQRLLARLNKKEEKK